MKKDFGGVVLEATVKRYTRRTLRDVKTLLSASNFKLMTRDYSRHFVSLIKE